MRYYYLVFDRGNDLSVHGPFSSRDERERDYLKNFRDDPMDDEALLLFAIGEDGKPDREDRWHVTDMELRDRFAELGIPYSG